MNWREIESAPRDGAMVLLYFSDTGTTIGKWHQPGNPACKGFWACAYHNKRYPTHWAPLPEAPTAEITDVPALSASPSGLTGSTTTEET